MFKLKKVFLHPSLETYCTCLHLCHQCRALLKVGLGLFSKAGDDSPSVPPNHLGHWTPWWLCLTQAWLKDFFMQRFFSQCSRAPFLLIFSAATKLCDTVKQQDGSMSNWYSTDGADGEEFHWAMAAYDSMKFVPWSEQMSFSCPQRATNRLSVLCSNALQTQANMIHTSDLERGLVYADSREGLVIRSRSWEISCDLFFQLSYYDGGMSHPLHRVFW